MSQISDPAPLIVDCKPERHHRIHCIWFVGRFHITLNPAEHLQKSLNLKSQS